MPDVEDGSHVVYHAKEMSRWRGPHPLLDRHLYFVSIGRFPAGRWNTTDLDAFYTSHDRAVALTEVRQHYGPGSLLGSDLADTGDRPLLQAGRLGPIPVPTVLDGRALRILDRPDIESLMAIPPEGHVAAQSVAAEWIRDSGGPVRLIVPSAPMYRTGDIRWNSVWLVGDGYVSATSLPPRDQIELFDPIPAY